MEKPRIALAMGDPAGISPELTARLLGNEKIRAAGQIVVFGDRRVLEAGSKVAGAPMKIDVVSHIDDVPGSISQPFLVDLKSLDPTDIETGKATERGGQFAIRNFLAALRYATEGKAAAVFFTPFNKQAMRLAHPSYDDEINFVREALGSHRRRQ